MEWQDKIEIKEPPGPGTYRMDIPQQIKQLTDQLAPRYKINPFGSNKQRFEYEKGSEQLTDQQAREIDLMNDLEAHVQVNRKSPYQREGIILRPAPSMQRIKSLESVIRLKEVNKKKGED